MDLLLLLLSDTYIEQFVGVLEYGPENRFYRENYR